MNWATRCPNCATVFRVAPEQLRVSEGFVRCGRCDSVFNAEAQLFDLNTGAPLQAPAAAAEPAQERAPAVAGRPAVEAFEPAEFRSVEPEAEPDPEPALEADGRQVGNRPDDEAGAHADDGPVWEEYSEPGHPSGADHAEPSLDPAGLHRWSSAEVNDRMRALLDESGGGAGPAAAASISAGSPLFDASAPAPSPLRRRLGFAAAVTVLAAALPLQWAWHTRDEWRARSPALESLWLRLCASCEPVALSRLDGVVVSATSLQPTPQGQAYHLRVRVSNQGPWPVRPPWLDLQLTDRRGKPLLRRSLSPTELGVQTQRVTPGEQLDLTATFSLDGGLTGYEVGIYHP